MTSSWTDIWQWFIRSNSIYFLIVRSWENYQKKSPWSQNIWTPKYQNDMNLGLLSVHVYIYTEQRWIIPHTTAFFVQKWFINCFFHCSVHETLEQRVVPHGPWAFLYKNLNLHIFMRFHVTYSYISVTGSKGSFFV